MKVILLENLKRIGSIGEIIDVKRGFARNFLIANKKALYASKENIKEEQKIKNELSKKDNEKKQDAKKIAEKVNKKEYSVKKLSTENNELYGSVKTKNSFEPYLFVTSFKYSRSGSPSINNVSDEASSLKSLE